MGGCTTNKNAARPSPVNPTVVFQALDAGDSQFKRWHRGLWPGHTVQTVDERSSELCFEIVAHSAGVSHHFQRAPQVTSRHRRPSTSRPSTIESWRERPKTKAPEACLSSSARASQMRTPGRRERWDGPSGSKTGGECASIPGQGLDSSGKRRTLLIDRLCASAPKVSSRMRVFLVTDMSRRVSHRGRSQPQLRKLRIDVRGVHSRVNRKGSGA